MATLLFQMMDFLLLVDLNDNAQQLLISCKEIPGVQEPFVEPLQMKVLQIVLQVKFFMRSSVLHGLSLDSLQSVIIQAFNMLAYLDYEIILNTLNYCLSTFLSTSLTYIFLFLVKESRLKPIWGKFQLATLLKTLKSL